MTTHHGEIRARRLAGIENPDRIGARISPVIPPVAAEFLSHQPMIFVAGAGSGGYPWGTILTGGPGFVEALSDTRLVVRALPESDDPFSGAVTVGSLVGAIAIEFQTRMRMRINGTVDQVDQGQFFIVTDQVYANCSQYIQARQAQDPTPSTRESNVRWHGSHLRPQDVALIERSDTTFLATKGPSGAVDMSHRGGMPGFIEVASTSGGHRLTIPDYRGNRFFNSFGNLELDPIATLLFIDFETGSVLHLGGKGRVDWSAENLTDYPGAQRLLRFDVEEAIERANVAPASWDFLSYSDKNPVRL